MTWGAPSLFLVALAREEEPGVSLRFRIRLGAMMGERGLGMGGVFMPQTPHIEKHFTAGEVVRDIVIGMSDGLTVPFALAAGLSGAVASTAIVVTAGLAEVAAG